MRAKRLWRQRFAEITLTGLFLLSVTSPALAQEEEAEGMEAGVGAGIARRVDITAEALLTEDQPEPVGSSGITASRPAAIRTTASYPIRQESPSSPTTCWKRAYGIPG